MIGEIRRLHVPDEVELGPFDGVNLGVQSVEIVAVGLGGPMLGPQLHLLDVPGLERQQRRVQVLDRLGANLLEIRLGRTCLPSCM